MRPQVRSAFGGAFQFAKPEARGRNQEEKTSFDKPLKTAGRIKGGRAGNGSFRFFQATNPELCR